MLSVRAPPSPGGAGVVNVMPPVRAHPPPLPPKVWKLLCPPFEQLSDASQTARQRGLETSQSGWDTGVTGPQRQQRQQSPQRLQRCFYWQYLAALNSFSRLHWSIVRFSNHYYQSGFGWFELCCRSEQEEGKLLHDNDCRGADKWRTAHHPNGGRGHYAKERWGCFKGTCQVFLVPRVDPASLEISGAQLG